MLRIYLTNLGKYNEGELVGEWVELPITEEELAKILERIGISNKPDTEGRYYEETFITDYETDIEGLEIGEYENFTALNELAEKLEDLDEYEQKAIQAFLLNGCDFKEALEKANNGDHMIYYDCENMEDVAREYAEETGLLDSIPENLQNYFDFEAFGRDMSFEGTFLQIGGDMVQIY